LSELYDHIQKKVVAGAVIPVMPQTPLQLQRDEETRGLVEALDCACAFVRRVNIRQPNPAILFGSGQLEVIQSELEASGCDLLVVDGDLTPIQQRNLEKRVGCKIIDRTGLILEIFGLRARTKAGRLQVETARLAYERSRLVRTWTHLERQRGGQGFISGPGETQIEADRRMIDNALQRLKKQLSEVEKTRRLQRASREARSVPIIALVGYTNAGKSTLFNKMTSADVFAKDMPFATLDPTIRQVSLPGGKTLALVDTVGFITDLPTALIEAFKATLEETMDADLILHVHDTSSPDWAEQADDVERVIEELEEIFDSEAPPTIDVWNKIDLLSPEERTFRATLIENSENPEANIAVSGITGEGVENLLRLISELAFEETEHLQITIPPQHSKAIAWLHQNGRILEKTLSEDDGCADIQVLLSVRYKNFFLKTFPEVVTKLISSEEN
jgi:GTP-binding protein HflX